MVKRLNNFGRLIYLFTALFPLYLFWAYYFIFQIEISEFASRIILTDYNLYIGAIFFIFMVLCPIVFFKLIKLNNSPDKEFLIKDSRRDSRYFMYFIGALSPLLVFIPEIYIKSQNIQMFSLVIASLIFIFGGMILVFRDDNGILYNLFFLKYHIITFHDKSIITKYPFHSGYIKVSQLNNRIFRAWN